jgi:hypothetical protein
MARNSHPAISLEPSDLANHPFMVIPTPAKANDATTSDRGNRPVWRPFAGFAVGDRGD